MFINTKNTLTEQVKKNKDDLLKMSTFFKNHRDIAQTYFAIDNLQNGTSLKIDEYLSLNLKTIKEGKKIFENISNDNSLVKNDIDKSIVYLVENEKTSINVDEYEKNYSFLKESIFNRTEKVNTKNIDDLLESITSSDQKIIIEQLSKAKSKEDFFNDFKESVLNIITSDLLITEEDNSRLILLEAKNQIYDMNFSETDFVLNTVKLHEIKSIFKEDK